MNKLLPVQAISNNSYELPAEVRTLNGAKFDPRSDKWSYRDSSTTVKLDFGRLNATTDFIYSAKIALVWYAENKSPKHMMNMFERFVHLSKSMRLEGRAISQVTSNDLLNYKALLSKATSWYLGSLSGFFQKWHSLGLPGVTDDAVALLKQLRIKGNQKGEAVLTMDPENGPYTDIELGAIRSALEAAYESNDISLGDYLLVWLFMALGQRPIQYAALKVCDVGMEEAKDGTTMYTLRVPRAKQRGRLSRELFSQRILIPQIGDKLVQYANGVRSDFSAILADSNQAPLFPAKGSRQNEPDGFEHHRTSPSESPPIH